MFHGISKDVKAAISVQTLKLKILGAEKSFKSLGIFWGRKKTAENWADFWEKKFLPDNWDNFWDKKILSNCYVIMIVV